MNRPEAKSESDIDRILHSADAVVASAGPFDPRPENTADIRQMLHGLITAKEASRRSAARIRQRNGP